MLRSTILFLLLSTSLFTQTNQSMPLRRSVQGQTIKSENSPALSVTFGPAFKHIGGDRFNLYGVADAELHLFVDADAQKNVRRYYWAQFEGYLPDNDHTYRYDEPIVNVSGLDFYVGAAVRKSGGELRAGSDSEHMVNLLTAQGYKMPALFIRERLVHMTDKSKRNELMIIYGEDAAPLGIKSEDVNDAGRTKSGWDKIATSLHQRATTSMTINH
jgi:hypothetical protein